MCVAYLVHTVDSKSTMHNDIAKLDFVIIKVNFESLHLGGVTYPSLASQHPLSHAAQWV